MNERTPTDFEYDGPTVPDRGSAGQVFIQMAAKRLREIVGHLDAIGGYLDELQDSEKRAAWQGVEDRSRELAAAINDVLRFSGAQRRRYEAIEDAK